MQIAGIPGSRSPMAGTCFFMPTGPVMANVNSGTIPFMTSDTFILSAGQRPMTVLDPGKADPEHEFRL